MDYELYDADKFAEENSMVRNRRIPDNDEIEDIMNITLTEEKKEELDRMRRKQLKEKQDKENTNK